METLNDLDRVEHNRVIWHSRRGMLELDIVLETFVKQYYQTLEPDQRLLYRRLLECDDQQLYDWFLKKKPAADTELASMIELILAYNRKT